MRSLKTQQRDTSRTPLGLLRLAGRRLNPVTSWFDLDVTFEHKLEEKTALLCEPACPVSGRMGKPIFTESLILAQDERWRRA